MICIDASALADLLLQTGGRSAAVAREITGADGLATLDLAWLEVASVLRRKLARGDLTPARAEGALGDLELLPVARYDAAPFIRRAWELRATHTVYDAAYIALSEALEAPLVTTDGPLARSRGHRAEIRLAT